MAYTVRPLGPDDAAAVQGLLAGSPGYLHRTGGHDPVPGAGAELLSALPPGAEGSAKTVLGLEREGELLGLCEVIAHWPERGTAHIGLLLIREDHAGQGLGRALHDSVVAQLGADRSLVRLRAGIVGTDAEHGAPFWHRLGYRPALETRPSRGGSVDSTTRIWTRPLHPAAGLHHLELWTADLAGSEPGWHWLLEALGWTAEPIEGWDSGRIWRHADGSYVVLERSADVRGTRADRHAPGMNHVALTTADRSTLDALRARGAEHGWRELFAARYPHAGGEEHVAWYAENTDGIEVEVVAAP